MLNLVRFAIILIASGLIAKCIAPTTADAAPPGSYLKSCGDAVVTGATLQASCKNNGGGQGSTTLPNFASCRGDISDDDGILVCDRGTAPPGGTYLQTCSHADILNGVLEAVCRSSGQGQDRTTLADPGSCRGDISNHNGLLFCNQGPALPAGTYLRSCEAMQVVGTTLEGECNNPDGKPIPTSLANYASCHGDISNFVGLLRCVTGDAPLPPGSYQASCGRIDFTKGVLRATCKMAQGGLRDDVLTRSTCLGSINNIDGYLSCSLSGVVMPPGSYLLTCIDPVLVGTRLSALCEHNDHSIGTTVTTVDTAQCGGGISNTDGVLGCNGRRTITVASSGSGSSAKFAVTGSGFTHGALVTIFVADAQLTQLKFSQSADATGNLTANLSVSCISGRALNWSASDGTLENGRQIFSNTFTLPCP